MKLKVVLEPIDDAGYSIYVPTLPGCISEGDARGEALANIEEAIVLYLEPQTMTCVMNQMWKSSKLLYEKLL